MTVDEVWQYHNCNWSKAMRDLKLGRNGYQYWEENGYIPMPKQIYIERMTKGKLKADINKRKSA